MITFPNAKINLGLEVSGRRSDGYHHLVTCYYPVPLFDVLEVHEAADFGIELFGLPIQGEAKDNLVAKAWRFLHDEYGLPPLRVMLYKGIPARSGLGGGSSDAAFFVKQAVRNYDLKITEDDILTYLTALGSDCPFFYVNSPMIGRGRGEILSKAAVDLSGWYLTLVVPEAEVETAWAFSRLSTEVFSPGSTLEDTLSLPVSQWKDHLVNVFTPLVAERYPAIEGLIRELYARGCDYVNMTGSGSALFSLSRRPPDTSGLEKAQLIKGVWL